ncbi:carbohydrate ABC transporter permease [Gracilibacillus salinarum]|uniref:Carbohydrate ABC transporter permease n=1 Tax=Gracilibacillus salinarum TaxID=2932255 RepID=A0ABY4GR98_9BACI|nr:carbohydrate ABC transporter permease [Gracilibacillus salinarum]UOQ86918.1 carbohydrate ABC transporter permease [Gracilibacillus salinarum]
MNSKLSTGSKIFNIFNYTFVTLISLTMILPFVHILAKSFSSGSAIAEGDVFFWPVEWDLTNYAYVFQDASIWRAFGISVLITVVGTGINLIATASLAYPLSRAEYKGRKLVLLGVLFTMIFSAPLIPTYLVIKELGMINTLWALMIPNAISAFNFLVMRSFFVQIPPSLIDAARIDGCSEMGILMKIVLPFSKPVMATMTIFYGVYHWNSYQTALYFLNDPSLYPLQVKLRQLIQTDDLNIDVETTMSAAFMNSTEGIQMATIIIATIPILIIYPLLQKHFVKGVMIGSIKE